MAKKDKNNTEELSNNEINESPKKKSKKTDSSDDTDFFSSLQKVLGDKVDLRNMDAFEPVPFFINSGSYATNWIISNDMINGGFPGTKLSLIVGASGKGKSLMATVALGNNIKQHNGESINIDIEESVNSKDFLSQIVGSEEVARKIRFIGAAPGDDGKIYPITIEKLNSILNKFIDFQMSSNKASKSLCVLTDSFSALTTKKEFEDTRADKDTRDMTAQQLMRKMLRVVVQSLRHANMTILGIGQMTANIGVMFGPKETMSVKGSAPEYWSSLILQMTSDKEILSSKSKVPIGIKMRLKTVKNRIKFKGRSAWLHFYFKRGIDIYGGLPELLANYEVFKASSKPTLTGDYSSTTKFTYNTDNGNEIKFKSSEFAKIVELNGGEKFIRELNDRLNKAYEDELSETNIEELLDSDEFDESIKNEETSDIEEGNYEIEE